VCVCVCEREREREREGGGGREILGSHSSVAENSSILGLLFNRWYMKGHLVGHQVIWELKFFYNSV
jgi:hypothetical protein